MMALSTSWGLEKPTSEKITLAMIKPMVMGYSWKFIIYFIHPKLKHSGVLSFFISTHWETPGLVFENNPADFADVAENNFCNLRDQRNLRAIF
jgi:hypothetical protein